MEILFRCIVEYKSPTDYLSINDFYKVYGYACFYKSDTGATDAVQAEELTITLVSPGFPAKLIRHLRRNRGYSVEKEENGIYYVKGDYIPVQIVVTSQLSEKENLWLKSLTNQINGTANAEKLLDAYGKHKNDNLYKAVMNVIVRANKETFQEVKAMCEALKELMKDETLVQIAKELVEIINENLTLDAFKREDARARIRVNIRRLLIKYNYPPVKREGAVEQVIRQAELKYANN